MTSTRSVAIVALAVSGLVAACSASDASLEPDAASSAFDGDGGANDETDGGSATDAGSADGRARDSGGKDASRADAGRDGTSPSACPADLGTDQNNCGSCGNACAFLSMCVRGQCETTIDHDVWPPIVTDSQNAYWYAFEEHDGGPSVWTIRSTSHAGTTLSTVSPSVPRAEAMSGAGAYLYLAVYESAGTKIYRVAKTGGAASLIAQEAAGGLGGNQYPGVVDVGGYVFWSGSKGVYRYDLATNTTELWAKTACVQTLTATTSEVYWSCYQGMINHRAVSAAPELNFTFAHYQGGPTYAVDAQNVYSFDTGGIFARPLSGGAATLRVAKVLQRPDLLKTDGTSLYWTDFATGSNRPVFVASNAAGATPIKLWDTVGQTMDLAPGGSWLYFVVNDGSLFRTPKQ